MAWLKCPKCAQIMHLSGTDDEKTKQRHPDWKPGDFIPDLCFRCWKEQRPVPDTTEGTGNQ